MSLASDPPPPSSRFSSVPPPPSARYSSAPPSVRRVVVRNTLFLTVAQIAGMPLAILFSAVSARFLGAAAIGQLYLGETFNSFGNLAVDWGQSTSLPQLVAQDRSRAAELLGTSLLWRVFSSIVVCGVLLLSCKLLDYEDALLPVVALVSLGYFFSSVAGACQQVIVGFERTDVVAYRQIIWQVALLAFTLPILLMGGGLKEMLLGGAAAGLLGSLYTWRALRSVGITRLSANWQSIRHLLVESTPFAFTSIASVLQPYVDAVILSQLASDAVVGYHAAARKLIGVLVFPASAFIGALYPTLCRLYTTNRQLFATTSSAALRGTTLLVFPVALGCYLYPDIGIAVYSNSKFGPAQDNLRILAVFLFLMYFTMPLGIAVLASGRQRTWAIVQSLCVVVSLVADPLLIPWFEQRTANGGLGVCTAAAISEFIVLFCAVWLVPKGTFDRRLARVGFSALLGGAAMGAVAFAMRPVSSFLSAPLGVVAYGAVVWVTGGVEQGFILSIQRMLKPKLAKVKQLFARAE